MIQKIAIMLFLGLGVLVCANEYDYEATKKLHLYKKDINAKEAFAMQKQGVLLVDVRTKREYNFSHPKGAKLVPVFFEKNGQRVYNTNFVEQMEYAIKDLDNKVMLICRSGSRTKYAANILADNGFAQVYNILNGYATKNGWIDNKLPVRK